VLVPNTVPLEPWGGATGIHVEVKERASHPSLAIYAILTTTEIYEL